MTDRLGRDVVERLRVHRDEFGNCRFCGAEWPCDIGALLADWERLRRLIVESVADVNAEVDALVGGCQRCGARVPFDCQVTDEAWRSVPDKWRLGVLCLPCVDDLRHFPLRLEDIGVVYFSGRAGTLPLIPARRLLPEASAIREAQP